MTVAPASSATFGARLLVFWPAKLWGTTLGMLAFFVAYFWVLRHPSGAVTLMPVTAVDRMIPFQPGALPLYLSLWIYVSLAPALIIERRELVLYGGAALGLAVAGLAIFLAWPTAIPRPDIDWSLHPSFVFLQSVDASGNACPSLHVAFAVFSAVWFTRLQRDMHARGIWRALNWLWCAGIVYATMATRQHVFLDVLAGAGLGVVAGASNRGWLRRRA